MTSLILQRHFDVRTGLLPANGSLVGRERTRLGTEEQDKCRCSIKKNLVAPPARAEKLQTADGARELLAYLKVRGLQLGLLSNSYLSSGAAARIWLQQEGILSEFVQAAVLFSDEIGVAKPDSRAFTSCLEILRTEPQDAIMVGDSLEFDIAPAQSLGMNAIWMSRRESPDVTGTATYHIFASLNDILEAIKTGAKYDR